ncbi:putative NAD-binding domain 4 protein [Treponema primitia ZAS-2]|uniref:Putative NAD-binding domain 4 protein n=1 Tax=Treponema primitia (strain ATCC BAA-887 / DSM 12427 / ZAS-2) TaxID=545694 RepID=F5YN47_TREPZ|nr:NAD(P)-dependent oxidoreductase [Treponema primitia]AEF83586.1 putative NAD-binding domain 4 protein [Treponema primitia ZAS-2]
MNILITGASGFLGKNLLKYIQQYKSNAIKIFLLVSKNIEGYNCIIHKNYTYGRDELPHNIDVLIHMGAFSPKSNESLDCVDNVAENIMTTNYLLENLSCLPTKIIFISSISVYNSKNDDLIDETTQTKPDTMYGASKLFCEKIIESFCKKNNIDYQIFRSGVLYGPEDPQMWIIPTVIKNIRENKNPVVFNGGNELKSFVNVSDCSRVIYQSLFKKIDDKIINIVSDQNISIKTLIDILIKISGKNLMIENIINEKIYHNTIYNNNLLVKNYDGIKIDYYEGLKEAYESYK